MRNFFRRKSKTNDATASSSLPTTSPEAASVASPSVASSGAAPVQSSSSVLSQPSSWFDNGLGRTKYLNLLFYIINVVITYGVGVLGWYGKTNSEVSAEYPTLLTPVGWAFSIWAVIFIAQAVWVGQQFLCKLPNVYVEKIGAVNCNYILIVVTQCSWTLLFASQYITISAVWLLVLMVNLFIVVRSLANTKSSNIIVYLTTQFPFAIHFGWVLAASVVAVNLSVTSLQGSDSLQFYVSLISLAVLTVVAALLACMGYLVPPLVIAYALLAVFFQNIANPIAGFSGDEINAVKYGSLSTACFIVLVVVLQFFSSFRKQNKTLPNEDSDYYRVQDGAGRL